MKSFSAIVLSVALACCAANASALVQSGSPNLGLQDVCEARYALQRNLASVLTDPTGLRTLNEARESVKNMCTDPRAHNALVGLLDVFTDVVADPTASQTLGNALFWARRVLKEKNFRVVWLEMMRGLNMVFERAEEVGQASNAVYGVLERTLRSPYFDTSFNRVVSTLGKTLKARNDNKLLGMAFSLASAAKNAVGVVGVVGNKGRNGNSAAAGRNGKSALAGWNAKSAAEDEDKEPLLTIRGSIRF